MAPPGTLAGIAPRINADINKLLASPATAEKLTPVLRESTISLPDRLQDRALREAPMWAEVINWSAARTRAPVQRRVGDLV